MQNIPHVELMMKKKYSKIMIVVVVLLIIASTFILIESLNTKKEVEVNSNYYTGLLREYRNWMIHFLKPVR